MIRRLSTAASAMSLLLCLAMVGLVIARPWKTTAVRCGRYAVRVRLAPSPGLAPTHAGMSFQFSWPYANEGDGDEPQPSGPPHVWVGDLPMRHHRLLGLPYTTGGTVTTAWLSPHRYREDGLHSLTIAFAYGPAAALLGALPAAWSILHVKRLRRARLAQDGNRCASCGYDLRAGRDRCPECGTPVSSRVERLQP